MMQSLWSQSLTRVSNIYFLLFPHRGTKCYIFPQWHEVVQLCPTLCDPWTVVYQAPPSKEISKQEYWSGLPFPSPEDLPNPGIEPRSPALLADTLSSEPYFPTSTALMCMCSKLFLLCPTICDNVDYSSPLSMVHGILQARIL